MRSPRQMAAQAKAFSDRWAGQGYEKGDTQKFWIDLLSSVFNIENAAQFILFEQQIRLQHTGFIDAHIPSTNVIIEQKSIDRDLRLPTRQSDGTLLSPFQQAKRYAAELPYSQRPRWIVTCNFREFLVYDMEQPQADPLSVLLKDLEREYYRLQFLVDNGQEALQRELEVSVRAGEIIGEIYDNLPQEAPEGVDHDDYLHALNIFCVRLVFCFYAEDAGIFGHNQFHDYLSGHNSTDYRRLLRDLFEVLNQPLAERDPFLEDELKAFPYVNGGLFAGRSLIPPISLTCKTLILDKASRNFDWSAISPTIFGAVFESTLNPDTRRSGGMHYTSIENIHKVIDPLFLDSLRAELGDILLLSTDRQRQKRLEAFQEKLASLTFFDPACGSGNFLTETYLSLRRLENRAIKALYQSEAVMGAFVNPVKVNIHQFYGIEINDFAVTVATTALWISEAQMLAETERIVQQDISFLPLKSYSNIHHGNALRTDWAAIVPPHLNYIIGNPPFVGARWMSKEQKQDVLNTFGEKWPGVGDLDYVACWYKKAADLLSETPARAAFVSTNSITQGGAVVNLWKPLKDEGVEIEFAWRTFRWDSEASLKAHVHCVIVGFSKIKSEENKLLFIDEQHKVVANNINGYLLNAPDIYLTKRLDPICDVPALRLGGQAIDDGNLTLTQEQRDELLRREPQAAKFVRPYMMGKDFLIRKPRYCLWLQGVEPSLLRSCRLVLERVALVKAFRESSKRASTLRAAATPSLFGAPFECQTPYVAIPKVSSKNRKYIPMDYLPAEVIPGDKLFCMQEASLYHFGVLTSSVHMAWMRATCGRLKSDYSYSNTIVYNNFPWPSASPDEQGRASFQEAKARIEQTAQAILDARRLYPDSSLDDLYHELTMPIELRRAHQANDRAVLQAYGFPLQMSEPDIVAALFDRYQTLDGQPRI